MSLPSSALRAPHTCDGLPALPYPLEGFGRCTEPEHAQPLQPALGYTLESLRRWPIAARNSVIAAVQDGHLSTNQADLLLRQWRLEPLPRLWQVDGIATLRYVDECGDIADARIRIHELAPGTVRAMLGIQPRIEVGDAIDIHALPAGPDGTTRFQVNVAVRIPTRVTAASSAAAITAVRAALYGQRPFAADPYRAELSAVTWSATPSPARPDVVPETLGSPDAMLPELPYFGDDAAAIRGALLRVRKLLRVLAASVPGLPRTRRVDIAIGVQIAVTAAHERDTAALAADSIGFHSVTRGRNWRMSAGGRLFGRVWRDDDGRCAVPGIRLYSVWLAADAPHGQETAEAIARNDLTLLGDDAVQIIPLRITTTDWGVSLLHEVGLEEL